MTPSALIDIVGIALSNPIHLLLVDMVAFVFNDPICLRIVKEAIALNGPFCLGYHGSSCPL